MIKIEKVDISGIARAIYSARNAMNSWDKSDSNFETDTMGENDLKLAKQLVKAGTDHAKFMRMITVTMDIIAPMYWFYEFDTYKVGTVRNSCSKMHKLLAKPFEMNDFSFDKLPGYKNEVKQFRPEVDEETELWKRVNDDYDVSNQGRIRHGSRILSGSLHNDGYIFVTIHGKQTPLHRLIATAFIPNTEHKPEVNHKDGNKQNNSPENLEWVTRKENQDHAVRTGLQPKSAKAYTGKFTEEQRAEIKTLWDSGKSKREIAKMFGVSHSCIVSITTDRYKYAERVNLFETTARPIVDMLNELRDSYLTCDDADQKKIIWYSILQLLPESYNQRATVQLNYQVLRNMYHARKNHKLDEWRTFCEWVKDELPYSNLITD